MAKQDANIDTRVSSLETKFELFMREISDFKQEMRDRDNQRAAEIRELRQKHDADMKEMSAKIDANFQTFTKQLHSNFVQTLIGVGAIMAAIGGLLIAALK